MKNISVAIFTQKDDPQIKDCLSSVKNLTKEIVFIYPNSKIVETVRNQGIKKSKTDWVLFLDVDERATDELIEEIKNIKEEENVGGYKIPRKNIFNKKKWLRFGGWWPDYQIRLINKKKFVDWPKIIHSTPIIQGKIKTLKNPLLHYFHSDLEKMVEKTLVFEDIESDLLFQAKRKANTLIFFRKFFGEIYRRLIKNLGFLDGKIGIIESIYQAFSKTITYIFLYEKNKKQN